MKRGVKKEGGGSFAFTRHAPTFSCYDRHNQLGVPDRHTQREHHGLLQAKGCWNTDMHTGNENWLCICDCNTAEIPFWDWLSCLNSNTCLWVSEVATDTVVLTEHPDVNSAWGCHWANSQCCKADPEQDHPNFLSEEFISTLSPLLHLSPPILLRVGPCRADLPRERSDEIASSAGSWGQENKRRMERWRELHNDRDGWREERAIKRFRSER